ncbi:1-acyl-sn-glycerol-3-phosphate acyltransferase [Homoserinimonas sp. OAct 916]|uniref:lysophospholipid acyltransferase family protein n=1 Tax=Homoserinimonas sp. OAct 916 TaxID=2211450 RepID=UPI001E35A722|nr:lysophospholipid acyltransferase family protein [Homoserinimonas sp. OAct 916]
MSEKSRPSFFWPIAAIVLPIMNVIARYTIIDGQKLPKTGSYVLTPNHYSEIDPLVIGLVSWRLGRAPRFMTKASLFEVPVLGWLLSKTGQIPVVRAGSGRHNQPVQAAIRLVDRGQCVVVYPEGSLTRDPDMWPMRGKTGAARLALQHDIPVIPIAHWGTQQIMARYSKKISFFPRKHVTIKIGDPVDLSDFKGRSMDSATMNEATTRIMDAITAQLVDLRGEPAPELRWNPTQHNQKETGRFDSE